MSAAVRPPEVVPDRSAVDRYLRGLQQSIVRGLEALDGGSFRRDAWERQSGADGAGFAGNGLTCVLEDGRVFERAGVLFSEVNLDRPPAGSAGLPRVTTTIWRPGRTRPIESQVSRPMMIVLPMVVRLKCARSSGRCQGSLLRWPIAPLSALATRRVRTGMSASYRGTVGHGARRTGQVLAVRPRPGP